jgi:predicted CXXCH cytochrome family protein
MANSKSEIAIACSWNLVGIDSIARTCSEPKHRQQSPQLSASGPARIRASSEQEICIFCHTPHNASPIQPVWNRNMPVSAYTVYASNSLDAVVGQPTGSSKLCLSCHDGAIAVGSVLSRSQPIEMASGITTLPPGASNLGTDLSDDHPISFRYDSALAVRDPKIKQPSLLPAPVKLDARGEMQCTSCHDAHDNRNGKFLVMDNTQSQLCRSCHQTGTTSIAEHLECASCHKQHTAPAGLIF